MATKISCSLSIFLLVTINGCFAGELNNPAKQALIEFRQATRIIVKAAAMLKKQILMKPSPMKMKLSYKAFYRSLLLGMRIYLASIKMMMMELQNWWRLLIPDQATMTAWPRHKKLLKAIGGHSSPMLESAHTHKHNACTNYIRTIARFRRLERFLLQRIARITYVLKGC